MLHRKDISRIRLRHFGPFDMLRASGRAGKLTATPDKTAGQGAHRELSADYAD